MNPLHDFFSKNLTIFMFKFVYFYIEGSALANKVSVKRRNWVLATLQRQNTSLLLSYTLPVMPTGLTLGGLNLLSHAYSVGVRIDFVNILVATNPHDVQRKVMILNEL